MPRLLIALAALLVGMPTLWGADEPKGGSDPPKEKSAADKPQTPEEQFKALVKEQRDAQIAFTKTYRAAKTEEERNKLEFPNPQKRAKQVFELAEKNPKEPFAFDALIWAMQNSYGDETGNKALEALLKDHVENKKIGTIAQNIVYLNSPNADKLLRAILEKNPDHKAQGQACLALGTRLKQQAARAHSPDTKEAEKYFTMTVEKYSDVPYFGKKTLGDAAKGALFEMHNLAIGMTAPEIEGKDVDGKGFKLSDYRGKVVLLDFWGNW